MSNRGFFMHKTQPDNIKEAVWWEEKCTRRQGGYDLDRTNIPSSLRWLPKGTVLKLTSAGNAQAVKTATVTEKANANATTLKIVSGSLFKVGDTIAGAQISAIVTADGVDTLTVAALPNAVNAKTVVSDYDKVNDKLLGFSYDTLDLRDADASLAATPTLTVMEVEEDSLPFPINDDIKQGLNENGIALFKIQ